MFLLKYYISDRWRVCTPEAANYNHAAKLGLASLFGGLYIAGPHLDI